MRIKNLLQANAYLIAISLTLLITYLSLESFVTEVPINIDNSDKILHGIAYFVLTSSWLFAVIKAHVNFRYKILVALLVLTFGIIIEVLQSSITTYRTADYYDILANSFGIIFASVTFNRLLRFYKSI